MQEAPRAWRNSRTHPGEAGSIFDPVKDRTTVKSDEAVDEEERHRKGRRQHQLGQPVLQRVRKSGAVDAVILASQVSGRTKVFLLQIPSKEGERGAARGRPRGVRSLRGCDGFGQCGRRRRTIGIFAVEGAVITS
jgi:hypothetical protein